MKDRLLDNVIEPAQKLHVINKYLIDKELVLRRFPYDAKVIVKKANQDGTEVAVHTYNPDLFVEGGLVSFYTLLAKYIQIDCTVKSIHPDGTVILTLNQLGIAKANRAEPRIHNNGLIHVSNLKTAKVVIDTNMFQIPTFVKVAFDEFKTKLDANRFEFVKIDIFKAALPRRFNIVKKSLQPLLIVDTQDRASYTPENPKLLSYNRDIDEDIDQEIKHFREELIESEIIVPILYGESDEDKIPMGYIWVQNREKKLSEADLEDVLKLSQALVQRVLESNTMTVDTKIPVIDASKGGLQIQVEDESLINILPKQRRIVLDIYFKMQPPFTVMGDIRWAEKKTDNKLLLGLKLESKSDLPGERIRYIRNLESLNQEVQPEKIR
jgi:hypothetical protein